MLELAEVWQIAELWILLTCAAGIGWVVGSWGRVSEWEEEEEIRL